MLLCLDAGNTRLKWGLWQNGHWQSQGAVPCQNFATDHIQAHLPADWQKATHIIASVVAGQEVLQCLQHWASAQGISFQLVRSEQQACGVENAYAAPQTLGTDRWSALIGAHQLLRSNCLVVCAGTATTIDVLHANGQFAGGVILPGLSMMKASLHAGTAQLPSATGAFSALPNNTHDAIESGCLQAQLGAIERMYADIAKLDGAQCVLTGGAAAHLKMHLTMPCQIIDNLVLRGLLCQATALAK